MDLVIGLDSSTTSTKAIAWDRQGRPVAEGRAPVPMSSPGPGAYEQAPEEWWRAASIALRGLTAQLDPARIAALATTNQRETVGFLDAAGRAVRPGIVWLDERARPDVALLSESFGAARLHRITGRPPDPTPALYTLHWLRRTDPAAFDATVHFVDVHGYLVWRLTGERATSIASADPHGIVDLAAKEYSAEILAHLGLDAGRFFAAHAPGALIGLVSAEAAAETGLRAGTPVAAGGGDGQAAGLGCAVLGGGRAYLNLGTATVSGVHARAYRTDAGFRT
ncbi:MAG TPA: FGGY family carbohydrate kinase, partial [Crenalkalicoccus sp.]|nr:FGGY family carbohydrate kinase [Crenalkalicoccus sp.]